MIKIAILTKTHKDFHEFIVHLPGYIKCAKIEFVNVTKYKSSLENENIEYYIKTDTKPTNNKLIIAFMEDHYINEITIKKLTDIF